MMLGSAKESDSSSLVDEKDSQKSENIDNKLSEKDKDFGANRRNEKLANKILQEDIQKENEEILENNKIGERAEDKIIPASGDEIDEQKNIKEDIKIDTMEKNGNVENEKDKRRRILNEKEKERKSKMGKKLKDQLKDHKNEAIDQIISDIDRIF